MTVFLATGSDLNKSAALATSNSQPPNRRYKMPKAGCARRRHFFKIRRRCCKGSKVSSFRSNPTTPTRLCFARWNMPGSRSPSMRPRFSSTWMPSNNLVASWRKPKSRLAKPALGWKPSGVRSIGPELLNHYERVAKRRRPAVILVKEERCGGCRVGIPPQAFIEIIRSETIVTCGNCARILIHAEKLESPAHS